MKVRRMLISLLDHEVHSEKTVNIEEVVSSEANQNSIKIWRGHRELCRFWSGSTRR